MKRFSVVGALCVALAPAAVSAHHSFAAQYDATKQVTLQGTITKVEWMNPHAYFYIDVADESGKVVNWAVEGGAPNVLYREGWKPTSLKAGDRVTVVLANTLTAADGSRLRDEGYSFQFTTAAAGAPMMFTEVERQTVRSADNSPTRAYGGSAAGR